MAARDINAIAYFECSAKTGEGVTEFFQDAMRLAVEAKVQRERKMAEIRRKNKPNMLANLFCFT